MSYLNALASSGLTVSLRLYSLNHNTRRAEKSEAAAAAADRAGSRETAASRWAVSNPGPQSPEELAAGRVEARAQLAAEGSLGRLEYAVSGSDSPLAGEEAGKAGDTAGEAVRQPEPDGPLKELTPEEQARVRQMAQRDQEVKAHEQAHIAASGGLAGSPSYEYQTGPDGRKYAVGGEVSVRRGGGNNKEQALREAEAVKRGANAPAQPSSQDRAVAAQAEAEINRLRTEKTQKDESSTAGGLGRTAEAGPRGFMTVANGASSGAQAVGAYAAVKLSGSAVRPLLARI